MAFGGLVAAMGAFVPAARAGVCDQVGGVITGDWTITTVQTCTGIVYTVDGTININAGGSLTLVDGGLTFAKDENHQAYALNVNGGGTLVLDDAFVTTQTDAIGPFLHLAVTVSSNAGETGTLIMRNGAYLKFPGWFNATGVAGTPAVLNITDSWVTGFLDSELGGLGLDSDANNDAPLVRWTQTTASLYRARFERLYEYTTGGGDIVLAASTSVFAYDTYLGVDHSNVATRHNELAVDATSNAYLFNVTIDTAQNPGSQADWDVPFRPAAGGNVYIHRWAHVTVTDGVAAPISGSTIWSRLGPSATTAQYPDNGLGTTPSSRTLWYLGRAASGTNAWDVTDASGTATIPLYTDQITLASLPNAESFGNYEEAADFSTSTTTGGAFFPAYPSISEEDNNLAVSLVFSDLRVRTLPDLELRQSEYTGTLTVIQNQPFTVYARIYNSGQTDATGVSVAAYLDGIPPEVARADGLAVPAGPAVVNRTLNVGALATTGPHTLMLWVDPGNTIDEGGSAQENNNFVNITLNVVPPPEGFIAIATPGSNQRVEPGSALSVTGYVRDTDQNPLLGVPLRIELRSGATVYANTTATSSDVGFFVGTINVPASIQEGGYTLVVAPASGSIQSDSRPIAVQRSLPILYQPVPFIGLPYWLFLSIIGAVAAVVIGVTAYWKVYGLGKMVECGECGAFIPEDATACPKCGVEFEKDMAKCSNCQTWIPVDVKRCPECGVEFATGELEMADYQEKMRLQYDEVVTKFKDEAGRQLGRALSDREFQEWWRKQPTFVTFEDWLREEEDMRKMGSKPCPVCGTLNSVTATVCHKCGSLMKETRPPGGGGGGVIAGPPAPRPSSGGGIPPPDDTVGRGAAPYGGGAAAGTETIPHRVIRKPVSQQPVVQKKVVRKPTEGQGSEGSEGQSEGSGDDL